MKTSKLIPIADIISHYSNKLISQDYECPIKGYTNAANFIAGRSLHFIETYSNKENFRKYLSESFPWSKYLQFPDDLFEGQNSKEKIYSFAEKQKEIYGKTLEVQSYPDIITGSLVSHLKNAGFNSENIISIDIDGGINILEEESNL